MSDFENPRRQRTSGWPRITRRDFIKTTSLTAAGLALGCGSGGSGSGSGTVDFPLGVASGDVTTSGSTSSAVFWTKYVGNGSLKLKLFVGPDLVDEMPAPLDAAGFAHVELDGLVPGERYRYDFAEVSGGSETGQAVSGMFLAAPALEDTPIIRLGAASCAKNDLAPRGLTEAAERDLHAFLLLGDTSYNDGATDVSSYRDMWESNLGKLPFRTLRGATSVLATWDDHEVENNWDPETISASQLAAARQTFFEHTPMRRSQADPDRIWRSVRWGRTVEVFVLDGRSERLPSTRQSAQPQYLSSEQMAWLKDGLEYSDAVFKLIAHGVPISENADDNTDDGWVGYAGARDEILSHIHDRNIPGVLWTAGDVHYGAVGRVETSGPGSNQVEVIAGPIAQVPNVLGAAVATLHFDQFDFVTPSNGFAELEFRPSSGEVNVTMRSDTGSSLNSQTYQIA